MYVIKVNKDNSLSAPKKQRIMHRSKLVDDLIFLVPPIYNGLNMADYTVRIEYILPTSKEVYDEILVKCEEGYKEYLKYVLPVDTKLTREIGQVELYLTFINSDLDSEGKSKQYVRKTSVIAINVLPVSSWCNVVADGALTAVDQKIIELDARIKALDDLEMVDNISYEDGVIQLTANDKPIGDAITIENCDGSCVEDGVPVVDFHNYTDFVTPDDAAPENKDNDNVVEFDPMTRNKTVNNVIEF